MMSFESKIVSSLEKCFLNSDINKFTEIKEEKIFKNQRYSFQLACRSTGGHFAVTPVIESDIADYITIREVVNIPSELPTYENCSDMPEAHEPGLYPDLLKPLNYDGVLRFVGSQSRALWLTIDPNGEIVGEHIIKIKLVQTNMTSKGLTSTDIIVSEQEINVDIKDVALPEQDLIFTQWFYADCLADYYNVEVFSDRHFEICENFARTAVKNGRNMLMLPLLTYALDVAWGRERTTVQLIDVYKNGDDYSFCYENLDRWLDMCNRLGVKYYEISPFFSQWGALYAPKVIATIDGEKRTLFGWDTDSLSDEYTTFLRAFINGFLGHMKERGEDKKCWFHISDEPNGKQLERYKKVVNSISDLIEDYNVIDAISHYEFYEMGLIKTSIPAVSRIEPFLEKGVPNLWCYYSGCQCNGVSNCHFAMPLARVRSLGMQLYKYDIKGFLQWGYNFYNNQASYDQINPFLTTDAQSFVASGDAYMVYPAPDGTAWESTRLCVLYEAMEDMRAMQLAQTLHSKEAVVKIIEDIFGEIKFNRCVKDSDTMMKIRRSVNEMIFANY